MRMAHPRGTSASGRSAQQQNAKSRKLGRRCNGEKRHVAPTVPAHCVMLLMPFCGTAH
jgi:hypothetical protein